METDVDEYLLRLRDLLEDQYQRELKAIEADLYIPIEKFSKPLSGGKKLRPLMILAVAEACGGKVEDAMDFAVAAELLHGATLNHDDIVDQDAVRRGQSATHILLGIPMAVFAGDAGFARALHIVTSVPKYADKVVKVFSRVVYSVCRGVAMEFALRQVFHEDPIFETMKNKTAMFFAGAAQVGAVSANAPVQVEEAAYQYGLAAGVAFQLGDDVVDLVRSIREKKPVGDLKDRRMTYPLLTLYKSDPEAEQKLPQYLAGKLGFGTILPLLERGEKAMTDASLAKIAELVTLAKHHAGAFPSDAHRPLLEQLPQRMVELMLGEIR